MDPMEPVSLVRTAAVLFSVGALGGLAMAGMRMAKVPQPPAWLAMLHGMLAAAGLALLVYAIAAYRVAPTAVMGVALLLVASVAGLVMNLNYHMKGLPLPRALMWAHAGVAAIGLALVWYASFGVSPIVAGL